MTSTWLLTASLVLGAASPALAQKGHGGGAGKAKKGKLSPEDEKRAAAREAFTGADEKFKANDFTGALDGFKKANDILPAPQALYKIAVCLDKLGKTAEATDAYKKFLAAPPPEKMAEQKTASEARLAELDRVEVKVTTTPPGASIMVDGAPQANASPTVVKLAPGKHKIELALDGYQSSSRDVDATSGSSPELTVELAPLPPPPPPVVAIAPPPSAAPPPPEAPKSKTPAYVALGVAGAGLVVGTIFGVAALGKKSDFKKNPTTATADATERDALISDMAFGAAVTLGVTGTVLLLNASSKKDAAPAAASSIRITPILTPRTQGAGAVFTF